MRACSFSTWAHPFFRSPPSPPSLRVARINGLRTGQRYIPTDYLNSKFLCIPGRSFHNNPQLSSIKTRWRETFLGEAHSETDESPSDHERYLSSYEQELTQLKHASIELHDILREGHPERILYALLSPFSDWFYHHASPSFFAATFALLDPKYFVDPFKEVYRYIKPSLIYGGNEIRIVRTLEAQFGALTSQLEQILKRREDVGHVLDLAACKHVLAFAAALADKQMADLVWKQMMPFAKIAPDIDCYAYYMEAYCWAGSWRKDEQYTFQVTEARMNLRRKGGVKGFTNYAVGPERGLRRQMTDLFKELVRSGLEADEAIFTELMVAMAREGDMEGVKSILKSVWNIDVELLAKVDEEEVETPSHYEEYSILRPTNRLLTTIAHVFGINNQVLLGFRLVDFVSRQYNLPIPYGIWFQILEFVYIFSSYPSKYRQRRGLAAGQVPNTTFEEIWFICTDEPHNIIPDTAMKVFRSRILRNRFQFSSALDVFENCKAQLAQDRENLAKVIDDLLSISEDTRQQCPNSNQQPGRDSRDESSFRAVPLSDEALRSPLPVEMAERQIEQDINASTNTDLPQASHISSANNKDPMLIDEDETSSAYGQIPETHFGFILPARWLNARRAFLLDSLTFERDLQLLVVLVRHMLKVLHFPRPARAAFERRFLPKLVENFADFLPNEIRYNIVQPAEYENQMTTNITLNLKATRMDALLKDWTSKRWGKALEMELFSATNARLRNLCQVDSHSQLVHVCQALNLDWLHKEAKTRVTGLDENTVSDKEVKIGMVDQPEGTAFKRQRWNDFLPSQDASFLERARSRDSFQPQELKSA